MFSDVQISYRVRNVLPCSKSIGANSITSCDALCYVDRQEGGLIVLPL